MEPQIAPLVERNLVSFKILSDSISPCQDERSIARSHLSRFQLWVGTLGAHRSCGGRSLEYRLRDSSFVRNHIISLLQDLVSSIDEGIQVATTTSDDTKVTNAPDNVDTDLDLYFQSDEQSEAMAIFDDIGHIIDCLLRLSITIRNPAPHDQFNSRAGANTVSAYRQWDMNHIREKFNHLDSQLVERLGIAMSRRRQYLKYREEHGKKLAHGLSGEDEGDNATTIASSIPKPFKGVDNLDSFNDALFDGMSETSGTSYASSSATTNELRVPNIPKESVNGPFQCPFCHMLIMINDRNSWKKHVFRDLQPYICLFANCSAPSQLYQRRKDWVAHMKQEHWVSWSCSFGCPGSFDTQESFKRHLTTVHGQSSNSMDLQAVINLCRFPNDRNIVGMCPLCLDYQIQSSKKYQSHIGDHLERLALFVLPHTVYDASDDEDEGGKLVKENDGKRSHSQEPHGDDVSEREELEGARSTRLTNDLSFPQGQYHRTAISRIENEEEYRRRLQEDLLKSGLDEQAVESILKDKNLQEHPPERPTYTRMARKHLSIETLRTFKTEFEYDEDPNYILIKRWVPEWEQDQLWQHTKIIREKRTEGDMEGFSRFVTQKSVFDRVGKGKTVESEKETDRHINDKHLDAPAMFECLFKPCPYKSKRESNCKQHMEKAHGWTYVRTKTNAEKAPSQSDSVARQTPPLGTVSTTSTTPSDSVPSSPQEKFIE